MFLSAVFRERWRNMSRSIMCYKMEIFKNQNFKKIGKTKTDTTRGTCSKEAKIEIKLVFVVGV